VREKRLFHKLVNKFLKAKQARPLFESEIIIMINEKKKA